MDKKLDFDYTLPRTVTLFPNKWVKKHRNFPGASTTKGYGPVFHSFAKAFAPQALDLQGGGSVMVSGINGQGETGGGGVGESIYNNKGFIIEDKKIEKFMSFLESLKNKENEQTIETVTKGFNACLEAKKYWSGKVTEKVKKAEKPVSGTFTKKAGTIVSELMNKAEGKPGTAVKKINFYINRAGDKLENKTELMKAKRILEEKNEK